MQERIPGQYLYGRTILHRMNALSKLISLFVLFAAIVLTDSLLGYLVITGITAAVVGMSRLDIKTAAGSVTHLWMFFLVIFIMNTLFYQSAQPLFSWWIFQISVEGMKQGGNVILRVIFLTILCNIFMVTTPPIEITNAIAQLLRPLKLFFIPTEDIAMIISVAMQFVPIFMEETQMIRKAQTARGARFESSRFSERAASLLPMVIPIFLAAFRRADELSAAMEARGYTRAGSRTSRAQKSFQLQDASALIISGAVCISQIFL